MVSLKCSVCSVQCAVYNMQCVNMQRAAATAVGCFHLLISNSAVSSQRPGQTGRLQVEHSDTETLKLKDDSVDALPCMRLSAGDS